MKNLIRNTALFLLTISIFSTAALSAELAGVTFPDTLSAGGKVLKLNGLGLRKKFVFKVYVGGLYLESLSKDANHILASDQAKAVRMHFLRDLSREQIVEAFEHGFAANARDGADQKAAFDKMVALIRDVKEGETLTLAYLPGAGTTLQLGDKTLGIFEGSGFAEAVFSIWLGPAPPTEELKAGMLGGG